MRILVTKDDFDGKIAYNKNAIIC